MKKLSTERLADLSARKAKIDLNIRALTSQERERKRREDTRAKIILGGALLAFFRREPIASRALGPRLLSLIAERDRALVAQHLSGGK